jgi:ABC-type nitrate/sulfonate/bicarbonate transport system substrate-binding protein
MLRGYTSEAVTVALTAAAAAGAKAGTVILRADAPIGTSQRLSQYYRKMGLGHGTFRSSVKAAKIRGRGSAIRGLQGKTIGYVLGPIGRKAFTRYWLESGFRHVGGVTVMGTHWVEHAAPMVFAVTKQASERSLEVYARGH